jgi:outer membrane protein OmpA-like peptidoglycan-associated protein
MRHVVSIGVWCAALVWPASAQRAGRIELGVLGNYARFDRQLGLENQFGAGGRLGWFLTDHLSLEVDGSYAEPQLFSGVANSTLVQGAGSVVLNVGGERTLFYFLAGYTRLAFTRAAPHHFSDNAVHAAVGDRVFIAPGVALRGEVRGLYTPTTRYDTGGFWVGHVVASFGVSFLFGGRPATDTDRDGLADRLDACPGTAAGATVDTRGCPADSDHDGAYNGLDACPNTPSGAQTDRSGCPLDGDNDGVPDGLDQCTSTAAGAQVDGRGCTADADGDRVPDALDQCPNTPPNTEVDTNGCVRTRDADGDGVLDASDRCPGTAAGARVDASGCQVLFTPERTAVVLRGVTFESGSSMLRPESYAVLDQVAASLVANPDIRIEIQGHTDNTGSAAMNLRLSQERATTVMEYLAGKGVSRFHMAARGFGVTQPVAPNTTVAGRAQNRRVELRRIP